MAKRFMNRRAKDFRAFLEAHGFYLANTNGDDDIYVREGYGYTVKIPNKNSEIVKNGTAMSIAKCITHCGFSKKDILDWWESNL